MKRIEKAFAKVNLTLDILGLRDDGFHEIESLMQLTTLCDTLSLQENREGGLRLSSNAGFLPLDEKNICYKAVKAFYRFFSVPEKGFDLHIEKHIPVSAGLGGGSADAAAVLRLLAGEYKIRDREALIQAAAEVGSDVPFCLSGGTALCRGRGEVMEKRASSPKPIHMVIAKNTTGLSTPRIYSLYDALPAPPSHGSVQSCLEALKAGDGKALAAGMFNVMEAVSIPKRPGIRELKEAMCALGAYGAMMSGSGSSVFALFPDEKTAKACEASLRKKKITAFACRFLNKTLF